MIQEDAQRCLELDEKIKALEAKIKEVAKDSKMAKILLSIPGFGTICTAELAGEIGTIERFSKEGSLALYLGMATLDNSSGKYQGSKAPKHVNTRAKAAMMVALDRHRKYVPESQRYYEKKRSEGKKHNQAIRALSEKEGQDPGCSGDQGGGAQAVPGLLLYHEGSGRFRSDQGLRLKVSFIRLGWDSEPAMGLA